MGALQSSGGNGGGADSNTLIGSGSEESGHKKNPESPISSLSPNHHLGTSASPLKSASAEIAVKTAAEIANASVISGKANRDAWYTSMAESVPGMTNVLQAIDSYEVAHSRTATKSHLPHLRGVSKHHLP